MKKLIPFILVLLIVTALPVILFLDHQQQNLQQNASTLTPTPTPTISKPTDGEGVYESCAPKLGQQCLNNLKQIASGGFKLVMNYDQLAGSVSAEQAYAKQASSVGIKIIWAFNNPIWWNKTNGINGNSALNTYPLLAAACNCTTNAGLAKYIIGLVKSLPATWGYYVGDEVSPTNHDKMKTLTDIIAQADSSHPRLFISYGSPIHSISYYISPFADTAEVLGVDYYPIGANSTYGIISDTSTVASTMQSVDNTINRNSAMVIQAYSRAQYPYNGSDCTPFPSCATFPTETQMQKMHNLALSNANLRILLWYSFFDILRSNNPSQHWADLVTAAGLAPTPTP